MMKSAGTDNPHRVFEELRARGREAVLLESGDGAGDGWTFVGRVDPNVRVPGGEAGLLFMRDFLKKRGHRAGARTFRQKSARESSAPPFQAGFVGFLSYDLGEKWILGEAPSSKHQIPSTKFQIPNKFQSSNIKSSNRVPEAHFVYVDKVWAFTNNSNIAVSVRTHALGKNRLTSQLSNTTRAQYFKKIARIKEYLFAGDTYQVNFSQKFEVPSSGEADAFELYKKLTLINPSPFQFFMETPRWAVISNSPERLMKIHGRTIETRPIKGTMPRGATPQEDEKNIKKLLESQKEKAELTMIVDLERNDIGKLCVPGTVEVNEHRAIEKYSHVIHTVSNVRGRLKAGCDWYDGLRALFPGGSITGCPKKRTMEIIRELEGDSPESQRGIYCGSAGYIDLSGNCDFNIMIRTMWLDKRAPGGSQITFRSGGGIVVDSDAQKEYNEALYKSQALLRALL